MNIEEHGEFMEQRQKKYIMRLLLLLTISLLLVISGCSGDGTSGQYEKVYTGEEGIVLTFLPDSPKNVYTQDESINLQIEVSNNGRYDYPEGAVFIDGFDKQAVFFSSTKKQLPPLNGKSLSNPKGDVVFLQFEESQGVKVPYGDSYKAVLQATSCYHYQTYATTNACIIPDINDINKGKTTCSPQTKKLQTQAAPVAVTQVEERITRDLVQFIITIENIGDGRIISFDKLHKCPYELEPKEVDIVYLTAQIDTLGEADCGENIVQLFNKKGVIICKFITRPEISSYETLLQITLDYGYSSVIKKDIQFINPAFTGEEIDEQAKTI